ncbi:MAG: DMT family transporter [Candidatus Berkiellales bacterium]
MQPSLAIGYAILAFAQIAISINVVTSKFLLATMPMFFLLAARFGLSTILLGILLLGTKTPIISPLHPKQKLTLGDWGLAILSGIFAAFLFNVFFVWGLQYTTATAAGIVGSTLPAMIALSAVWLLKERLNLAKIFALILAMVGILVINLDHFEETTNVNHTFFGDLLVFIAMFPEAWYSIISRKLATRITPLGAALIANAVGFLTLLPCAILSGAFDFTFSWWEHGLFVLIAGSSSLIFFWAWGWGLSFIPASTAAIFGGVMPVATALLAMIFLGEEFHWYDSLGMLLVIVSIAIGTGWHPFIRKSKLMSS